MADINNQQKIGRIITRLTWPYQNAACTPIAIRRSYSQAQEAFCPSGHVAQDAREITILLIGDYLIIDNKPLLIPVFMKPLLSGS